MLLIFLEIGVWVGVWVAVRVGVRGDVGKTPTLQLLFIHRHSERYGWVLGCFTQKFYFCTKTGMASIMKMKKISTFSFLSARFALSLLRKPLRCGVRDIHKGVYLTLCS